MGINIALSFIDSIYSSDSLDRNAWTGLFTNFVSIFLKIKAMWKLDPDPVMNIFLPLVNSLTNSSNSSSSWFNAFCTVELCSWISLIVWCENSSFDTSAASQATCVLSRDILSPSKFTISIEFDVTLTISLSSKNITLSV